MRIIGIRGIIHYSRQVCNPLFLAFQYSSPGGSTTAGEVCYLRLPCCSVAGWLPASSTDKFHIFINIITASPGDELFIHHYRCHVSTVNHDADLAVVWISKFFRSRQRNFDVTLPALGVRRTRTSSRSVFAQSSIHCCSKRLLFLILINILMFIFFIS